MSQWALWFYDFPTTVTTLSSTFIALYFLLISVCVKVWFVRYASFNLHILQLEICGLFEVDTFFSISTTVTPNNMEIIKEFSIFG